MNAETLIRNAYTAFNARDIDAVLAMMNPSVAWPNGMEGGTVHGHQQIREYWQRQWALVDPTVEPIKIHQAASGCYAVDVHQIVKDLSGSTLVDRIVRHTYRLQNGLIESMEISE